MNNNPKVTVCIFAYNLERFISRAIESVLMQKTDFDFEILIGEDCSTDKTMEICIDYAAKYPNKIRLLLRSQNLGMKKNVFDTLKEAKSEYVAVLDGDDYWINPLKLQKQVDFMDENPDYSLCCHNSLVVYEDYDRAPELFNKFDQKDLLTMEDIIMEWSMSTGSMFYRNSCMSFPELVYQAHNFDVAIQVLVADRGKVKYMKDIMSIYSKTSVSNSFNPNYPFDFVYQRQIELYSLLAEHFGKKYSEIFEKRIAVIKKYLAVFRLRKKYPFTAYLSPSRYFRFVKRLINSVII